MTLDKESALRLSEAIANQAAKDYVAEYKRSGVFSTAIEKYFREHPLAGTNGDYIIEQLRKVARNKKKVRRKTHRVRVNGKEVV